MSTEILSKTLNINDVQYIKLGGMANEAKKAESLADFVQRIRREKRLSLKDVERKSRLKPGGGISGGYVSQIENGYITNVTSDKLKALANGLDEDESVLMAIAFGKKRSDPAIEDALLHAMGYEYGKLSEKDKEALRPVLELVLEQIRQRQRLPK